MTLHWTSVQQFGADQYEIEQSGNGRNWTVVGVVPANRTDYGNASYSFNYNKNLSNTLFRVSASNNAGRTFTGSGAGSPLQQYQLNRHIT